MPNSFRVAATYIGAVMGAGFASGQEIIQFFVGYGGNGIWGMAFSGLLFAILGYLSLVLIKRNNIKGYQDLFRALLGEHLGKVCEWIVTILLFIGFIVMLAGSGAIFTEYFNLPATFGVLLTAAAVSVALASKGEGVIWINSFLIPLKLLICLMVSFLSLRIPMQSNESVHLLLGTRPWYVSSILYVSFNMTFALVVLASLGKELNGNTAGGILGGVGLGIFGILISVALLRFFPGVSKYQVPMVHIAFRLGTQTGILYLLLLWFAMLTAAVGNAFSFTKRMVEYIPVKYWQVCFLTLAAAIPLAHFQFSSLIAIFYPLFGYIGLILIGPLLYRTVLRH